MMGRNAKGMSSTPKRDRARARPRRRRLLGRGVDMPPGYQSWHKPTALVSTEYSSQGIETLVCCTPYPAGCEPLRRRGGVSALLEPGRLSPLRPKSPGTNRYTVTPWVYRQGYSDAAGNPASFYVQTYSFQ